MAQPARKLSPADVRQELLRPEIRPVLLAFLDLLDGRVRLQNGYKRRGCRLQLIDVTVNLHVYLWSFHGGTRAQTLIDSMEAPRSTIRDSLRRLEDCRLVCRDETGVYFATVLTGDVANDVINTTGRELGRIADAIIAYRAVHGRFSPKR